MYNIKRAEKESQFCLKKDWEGLTAETFEQS
jgi:hypothetical protein